MRKFEYSVWNVVFSDSPLEIMRKQGLEGWEAFQLIHFSDDSSIIYFKREFNPNA